MKRNPESVLDVGCARGYIVKKLEDKGIKAIGMDISPHCWHTRATDSFILHDATKIPWPFGDKEFDLCVSAAVLEHIPEEKVDVVIREMARVSKRGLHGISFTIKPNDIDKTHLTGTIKPREWWEEKFKEVTPSFPVEILDKEETEAGAIPIPQGDGLRKVAVGTFQDMTHYGWENWDILDLSDWAKANGYSFKQMDVTKGLPYENNSVDIIKASHFLEHLTREQGSAFLRECHRVLRPNGLIRLAIPDARLLAEKYLNGEIMEYRHVNIGVERAKDDIEAFFQLLMSGHSTVYDENSLKRKLGEIGFTEVKRMPFNKSRSEVIEKQCFDTYPSLSCYIEGQKHEPLYKKYLRGEIEEGRERGGDLG